MINRLLEQFEEERAEKSSTPPDKPAQTRANIKPGLRVKIVQKAHQQSGRLTEGTVKALLTSAAFHPRGIKVRLETGEVGRVHSIVS